MSLASPYSVSVILPAFIRHDDDSSIRLMRRALESVLDQAYPDAFEILVIDDGSPVPVRNTMHAAGFSELPGIRWIRSERNEGLVHALNTGLWKARYSLIARQDADDRSMPGRIAAQMDRFRADPDLTLTSVGMTIVDVDGKELEQHLRRDGWENILHLAAEVGWSPFCGPGVLALSSIFRLLGGFSHDPTWRHAEDWHLWSIWIRFFKPAQVEELLYEYNQIPSSVSHRYREQQRAASRQIHRQLKAVVDWKTHPGNVRRLADILGVSLMQCGAICYRIWRYRPTVRIPRIAVDAIRRVLPDRDIDIGHDGQSPIWQIEDLADGFPGVRANHIPADDTVVCCRI